MHINPYRNFLGIIIFWITFFGVLPSASLAEPCSSESIKTSDGQSLYELCYCETERYSFLSPILNAHSVAIAKKFGHARKKIEGKEWWQCGVEFEWSQVEDASNEDCTEDLLVSIKSSITKSLGKSAIPNFKKLICKTSRLRNKSKTSELQNVKNKHQEAITACEQAPRGSPAIENCIHIGSIFKRAKFFDEAARSYEAACSKANANGCLERARMSKVLGESDEGESWMRKGCDIELHEASCTFLGQLYEKQDREKEALSIYKKLCFKSEPNKNINLEISSVKVCQKAASLEKNVSSEIIGNEKNSSRWGGRRKAKSAEKPSQAPKRTAPQAERNEEFGLEKF